MLLSMEQTGMDGSSEKIQLILLLVSVLVTTLAGAVAFLKLILSLKSEIESVRIDLIECKTSILGQITLSLTRFNQKVSALQKHVRALTKVVKRDHERIRDIQKQLEVLSGQVDRIRKKSLFVGMIDSRICTSDKPSKLHGGKSQLTSEAKSENSMLAKLTRSQAFTLCKLLENAEENKLDEVLAKLAILILDQDGKQGPSLRSRSSDAMTLGET